jgi:hypothetical protein
VSMTYPPEQLEAFHALARIVAKEVKHLDQTRGRLVHEHIDTAWVNTLESNLDLAERVEAFSSRFGRLQDTLGDKLLPRMARLTGFRPAAPIELLAQAEKLGWIASMDQWLEWRKLRNRLVHEYVSDPAEFADALNLCLTASLDLIDAESTIRNHASQLGLLVA